MIRKNVFNMHHLPRILNTRMHDPQPRSRSVDDCIRWIYVLWAHELNLKLRAGYSPAPKK
jgi:hypothetical protein